ncbi:MAG: hypothetical protein WB564_03130 [Dehalococcoidia bacterium]
MKTLKIPNMIDHPPISEIDKALQTIHKPCFSNHWLYLCRAARDLEENRIRGWVNGANQFAIGERRGTFHVIILSRIVSEDLTETCKKLSTLGKYVLVRKLSHKEYLTLLTTEPFKEVPETMRVLLEDDAFPEQYLQLETLISSISTPAYRKLRRALRRFAREVEPSELVMEKWSHPEEILDFVYEWSKGDSEKFASYKGMIAEAFDQSRHDADCFVFRLRGRIIGLYILGYIKTQLCGLYCGITSKEYRGQTEALDFKVYESLYNRGYRQVLIGGAENLGVLNYLGKFCPSPVWPPVYSVLYCPKS